MPQLDTSLALPVSLSAALIYAVSKLSKIGSRDAELPPGPPTLPLLGNLTILPLKDAHIKFTEWSRTYGGVYSLKVGSQTIIVVSSPEAIYELLEKNGAITVSRPHAEALVRVTAPSGMVSMSPYGPQWRKMRKAAAELMKPSTRLKLVPIRMAEVTQLLFDTQEKPQDIYYHIQRVLISTLFSVIGGVRIPQVNTELSRRFFHVWNKISEICEPGNTPPVDLLPILQYIPDTLLGNWQARCANVNQVMIQNAEQWNLNKEDITGLAASLVMGGVSTTTTFLQTVFLLATAHPEAQKAVQEEMDRVIGADRAPTPDDIPKLPQLNAFIREAHRFRTVLPLGLPHFAMEDQFYQGKLIPKGSTIYLNVWAMFHDPELYDQPDVFDPSRFIRSPYGTKEGVEKIISEEALKRLETLPFGAGRRRCVGLPLATESSEFIAASLFWAFEFCHFVDDNGNRIEPNISAYISGLSYDPLPYKCSMKPRSQRHKELIEQNYINSTPVLEQFEGELSEDDRVYLDNVRTKLQA
ncbi:hypothetical protein FRC02_004924 [Tulasnella sp. 418]|nr:hypothetical protein FRC02_004924 [Tulasnella sp. 418]